MIRTVVSSDTNVLSLNIPDQYIGRMLEIIAFAIDEPSSDVVNSIKAKKKFTSFELNTKDFKFDREDANGR